MNSLSVYRFERGSSKGFGFYEYIHVREIKKLIIIIIKGLMDRGRLMGLGNWVRFWSSTKVQFKIRSLFGSKSWTEPILFFFIIWTEPIQLWMQWLNYFSYLINCSNIDTLICMLNKKKYY